jgi:hypothetical protein
MPALRWIDALKEWNKVKSASDSVHSWAIPRKGSEGYQKVKKLMDDSKKGPAGPYLRSKAPAGPDLRSKVPAGPDLRPSFPKRNLKKKT